MTAGALTSGASNLTRNGSVGLRQVLGRTSSSRPLLVLLIFLFFFRAHDVQLQHMLLAVDCSAMQVWPLAATSALHLSVWTATVTTVFVWLQHLPLYASMARSLYSSLLSRSNFFVFKFLCLRSLFCV